jgi:hypothetical protein
MICFAFRYETVNIVTNKGIVHVTTIVCVPAIAMDLMRELAKSGAKRGLFELELTLPL